MDTSEKVKGGLVHVPKPGMYTNSTPVGCLDFKGLYPHVIIAYNLCPTTVARRAALERLGYVHGRDFATFAELGLSSDKLECTPAPEDNETISVLYPHVRRGLCPEVAKGGIALRETFKQKKKDALREVWTRAYVYINWGLFAIGMPHGGHWRWSPAC